MSHFHLKLFSYIDMIWMNISQAALDLCNVNVITKQQPISDIDMSIYIRAVTVVKALASKITISQSQGAPISIVPAIIITKYCPTAALWQEKQPAKSTPPSGSKPATTPAPCNGTTKHDHSTPEGASVNPIFDLAKCI